MDFEEELRQMDPDEIAELDECPVCEDGYMMPTCSDYYVCSACGVEAQMDDYGNLLFDSSVEFG